MFDAGAAAARISCTRTSSMWKTRSQAYTSPSALMPHVSSQNARRPPARFTMPLYCSSDGPRPRMATWRGAGWESRLRRRRGTRNLPRFATAISVRPVSPAPRPTPAPPAPCHSVTASRIREQLLELRQRVVPEVVRLAGVRIDRLVRHARDEHAAPRRAARARADAGLQVLDRLEADRDVGGGSLPGSRASIGAANLTRRVR
jgi:hypothetical protein